MTSIGEILRGRTDLSAFIVHLTKGADAEDNIKSMLTAGRIEARHPHGWNQATLQNADANAVCFTETFASGLDRLAETLQLDLQEKHERKRNRVPEPPEDAADRLRERLEPESRMIEQVQQEIARSALRAQP